MTLSPTAALEALLFSHGEPLARARIAKLLELSPPQVDAIVETLEKELVNRGLTLVLIRDLVELRTSSAAAPFIKKLREDTLTRDIGRSSLETLGIILYQGGATRTTIDWIRGVNSSTALRALLIRGLIVKSEHPEDRRRVRYEATPEALGHLGVRTIHELPDYDVLSKELTATIAVPANESADEMPVTPHA